MKNLTNNISRSLGLIGCGYWGKNLARVFNELGALHTICESAVDSHQQLESQYPEVNLTDNLDEVLSNPDIHEVAIAAPAIHHYSLAKMALSAGKDVFVEKPFCLKASEGRELKSITATNEKILMVGHLLQYHPAICRLQEMVQDDVFGKLFRITSHRLNLGKVRKEENAFWSLAPHDISVILSLVKGAHPIRIQSIAENYLQENISDCSLTSIAFSNGVTAEIQVSWLHPFKEQKLCVIGEDAMAVFDDTQNWDTKLSFRQDYFNSSRVEVIPLSPEEPLKRECQHFLQACKDRTSPKTDADEGLGVVEILEVAQASADAGGIPIELITPSN